MEAPVEDAWAIVPPTAVDFHRHRSGGAGTPPSPDFYEPVLPAEALFDMGDLSTLPEVSHIGCEQNMTAYAASSTDQSEDEMDANMPSLSVHSSATKRFRLVEEEDRNVHDAALKLEELNSQLVAALQRRDWGLQTLMLEISAGPRSAAALEFEDEPSPKFRDDEVTMENQLARLGSLLPRAGTIAQFLREIRCVVGERDQRIQGLQQKATVTSQQHLHETATLGEENRALQGRVQDSEIAADRLRSDAEQQQRLTATMLAAICDLLSQALAACGSADAPPTERGTVDAEGRYLGELARNVCAKLVASEPRPADEDSRVVQELQQERQQLLSQVRSLSGQLERLEGEITKTNQVVGSLKRGLTTCFTDLVQLVPDAPFQLGSCPSAPSDENLNWAEQSVSWLQAYARWLREGHQQTRDEMATRVAAAQQVQDQMEESVRQCTKRLTEQETAVRTALQRSLRSLDIDWETSGKEPPPSSEGFSLLSSGVSDAIARSEHWRQQLELSLRSQGSQAELLGKLEILQGEVRSLESGAENWLKRLSESNATLEAAVALHTGAKFVPNSNAATAWDAELARLDAAITQLAKTAPAIAKKDAKIAELSDALHQHQQQAAHHLMTAQLLEHKREEVLTLQTKIDHLNFVVERQKGFSEHRSLDIGEKVQRLAECNWYLEQAVQQREQSLRRLVAHLAAHQTTEPHGAAAFSTGQPASSSGTWDVEVERCLRVPSRINELAAFDEQFKLIVSERDGVIARLRCREGLLLQQLEETSKATQLRADELRAALQQSDRWREALEQLQLQHQQLRGPSQSQQPQRNDRPEEEELYRWESEEQFHRNQLQIQEEEERTILAVELTYTRSRVLDQEHRLRERRRREQEARRHLVEAETAERRKLLCYEDDTYRAILRDEVLGAALAHEEARRRREAERRRAEETRLLIELERRRAEEARRELERRDFFAAVEASRTTVERSQMQEWRDLHRDLESRLLAALEQEKARRRRLCPFIGVEISEGVVTLDPENPVVPGGARVDHPATGAGVKVVSVKGPAAIYGLEVNDVITSLDGRPTNSLVAFKLAAMLVRAGQVIRIAVLRNGAPCEVLLQTDEKDADEFLPGNRYTRRVVLRGADLAKLQPAHSDACGSADQLPPPSVSVRGGVSPRRVSPRRGTANASTLPPATANTHTRARSNTPTATRTSARRFPTPSASERQQPGRV